MRTPGIAIYLAACVCAAYFAAELVLAAQPVKVALTADEVARHVRDR